MTSRFYRQFALILCFLLSLLTGSSLVFHLLLSPSARGQTSSIGLWVGKILFDSFHYAAFFIPLYFAACGVLLLYRAFRQDLLVLLNLLLLPFFTLSLALRLLFSDTASLSPLPALFARSFTSLGGGLVALLLFVLEIALLPEAYRWISRKLSHPAESSPPPLRLPSPASPPSDEASREETGSSSEDSVPPTPDSPAEAPGEPTGPRLLTLDHPQRELPALREEQTDEPLEPHPVPEQAESQFPAAASSPVPVLDTPTEEQDDTDDQPDTLETEAEEIEAEEMEDSSREDREEEEEHVEPGSSPSKSVPPSSYSIPIEGILHQHEQGRYWEIDGETRRESEVLRATLEEFKIQAEVVGIRRGPVITMFEILPAPGVKLSRIVNLADNIALRLAASSVRIVAPIPGKHAVGIEVPNRNRSIVTFAEMISEEHFHSSKMEIPIALGKDIAGEAQIIDLVNTPHLLIAGATGSGKSVCVNSIICSILYRRSPAEVRLLLIDPKIVELKLYNDIPHLLTPVITEPKRAFQALQYAIYEMERRYSLLDGMGVRDIRSYNRKIKAKHMAALPLPYIVIIIDEFADLMATTGKELESTLARLAAMSRAVGIHLVLATQRPSIDVITGLIKANIPSRIAFMVASKFDSRIIIDTVGAEKLLGRGDLLFTSAWDPFPIRMQGAFVSEEEIERIVEEVRKYGEPEYIDDEIFIDDEEDENYISDTDDDPLLDKAIEIVTAAGKASASYLQRRLKVGYNRAARMIEIMERRGIVGPADGSKPRKVL
ncbi:MAG: hypothetical protein Kow009_02310 [Spirochaetales bacterium]